MLMRRRHRASAWRCVFLFINNFCWHYCSSLIIFAARTHACGYSRQWSTGKTAGQYCKDQIWSNSKVNNLQCISGLKILFENRVFVARVMSRSPRVPLLKSNRFRVHVELADEHNYIRLMGDTSETMSLLEDLELFKVFSIFFVRKCKFFNLLFSSTHSKMSWSIQLRVKTVKSTSGAFRTWQAMIRRK